MGAAETEREARRLFPVLSQTGAHLARQPGSGDCRLLYRADDGKIADEPLSDAVVDAFLARGWLVRAGNAGQFVLSEAGAFWYARAMAEAEPFAAQHQIRVSRQIQDRSGRPRAVTVDEGESVLSRLKRRGLIDAAQFDAGEKLRRDFTLAQLMPRLGVDLTAPIVSGRRGHKPDVLMTDTVLAAKQRFSRAMKAVGPGLSDLLFDICCQLRGLEDAERAYGWPNRSARVVLGLALDRLADHYGLRVTGTARIRGWRSDRELCELENNTM